MINDDKPLISIQFNNVATNSGGNPLRHWDNETPPGGLTEVYVYKPDSKTVWPDDKLGQAFSQIDPRCCLPGNIGPADIFHARPLPSSNTSSKLKPTSQFKQVCFYKTFSNIFTE